MVQIDHAIEQHSLRACTDWSYDPNQFKGAHGWVFATPSTMLWQGAGASDGHKKLSSPYQAELSGLVDSLYILHKTCQFTNTLSGTAILYCDCNRAIGSILKPNYQGITDYLVPDSDHIQEAKSLIKHSRIKIVSIWVKGHTSTANQQAAHKLNQMAHDVAYNFLKHPHPQYILSVTVIAPSSEKVLLEYKNSLITSKLSQLIKHQFLAENLITTIYKEAK
jgi:hypothetical protein